MNRRLLFLLCAAALAAGAVWVWHGASGSRKRVAQAAKPSAGKRGAQVAAETKQVDFLKKLMAGGEVSRPTAEQLRAFVEKQGHSAASLLAAWQLGGDAAWLDEAAARFPNDPHVALAKLSTLKDLNAEAREWIDRLKENDPGNALGWSYDALSKLKEGSPDAARAALAEAARLGRFDGYSKESAAALTEAYRSAGYGGLEGELLGLFGVPLPQVSMAMNLQKELIAKLGPDLDDGVIQDMLSLAKSVRGDDRAGPLITDLVALAMERKMLNELSALELVPGTSKVVAERLGELDAEKLAVKNLVADASPLLPTLSESELKQYLRRLTVEGEMKAMQWVLRQRPQTR